MKLTHSGQQLWGPVYPSGYRVNMENRCTSPDFPTPYTPLAPCREPALIIRVDLHQARDSLNAQKHLQVTLGILKLVFILLLQINITAQRSFTLFCSCRPGQAHKRSHSEEGMGKRGSFLPRWETWRHQHTVRTRVPTERTLTPKALGTTGG